MKSIASALVFLLVGLGLAQQPNPPSSGTPPTFPQEQTPRQPMPPDQEAQPNEEVSSAQVQQQIQQSISTEPALATANVNVKTDDSSVVLTGTADSEKQHQLALRIAQSYAGKRQIVDKIKVSQQT